MLYLLIYAYNRMVRLHWLCHALRAQIRPRYLIYTALLIVGFISLELWLQDPYQPGKYLVHKKNSFLLREIELAGDARIPHSVPVVPRIVHFTWGAKPYMRFHNMICMLSAYHIIRPDKIIIWYSVTKPSGEWWDYLMRNVSINNTFDLRFREDPTEIFGRRIRVAEHKSDVVRLDAVRRMGGIYLDTDVVTLKTFDPLLSHDVTMGLEEAGALCNGVIIAKPNATFLNLWWEEYHTFNDGQWGQHSVLLPALLAKIYPHLCLVLPSALNRPNWRESERAYIYGEKKFDWMRKNYAMHLWFRFYNVEHDLESVKTLKSTYGEICRYILYGQYPA